MSRIIEALDQSPLAELINLVVPVISFVTVAIRQAAKLWIASCDSAQAVTPEQEFDGSLQRRV